MVEGDKCSYQTCNKIAIGYEVFGHCGLNVCEDHASSLLLHLSEGTKLINGTHRYNMEIAKENFKKREARRKENGKIP